MAGFKVVAVDEAGSFELRQHAIHRGKAHVFTRITQLLVDIFRTQVLAGLAGGLQDLQDFDPRQRDLEAGIAQFLIVSRHGFGGSLYRSGRV